MGDENIRRGMRYLLAFLLLCSVAHAEDRVNVQVQFKKFVWTCPVCKAEDIVDANVGGGNTYEHTCKNGHKFNQSGNNMREYNGCLSYTPSDYEAIKSEDLIAEKKKRCDDWLYSVKNPPAYVEPTLKDYENMRAEKQKEIDELDTKIAEKGTVTDLQEVKVVAENKVKDIDEKITNKSR
jgi:hypothetical protein